MADEPGPSPDEPTPEQLIEQIRGIEVADLVLSSMSTIAQLGYAKLEAPSRDLAGAKLAIEALRALVPVLDGVVDEAIRRDFKQVVANLQLAYAQSVDGDG